MHFADQLLAKAEEKKSVLCVGLDPHMDLFPEHLLEKYKTPTEVMKVFFQGIIDATAEYAIAVKPNLAFFEIFGVEGWRVLEEVSAFAQKKGLLVIADAKRNDIGTTAKAYAEAFLGEDKPYDAITVTPYLGQDGILPFIEVAERTGKGIFVLAKTSNKSAGEFQDLPTQDGMLFEEVARAISRWGSSVLGESNFSLLGAVVGATYPDDMRMLRAEMPSQIFLIPGFGAQGGTAEDVTPAFYKGGKGAIVNSSREILFASSGKDYLEAAAREAKKAKELLWKAANQ